MPKSFLLIAVFVPLVLAGCGRSEPGHPPKLSKKQRAEAAETALSKNPEVRTYRLDGNELKSIEVPVKDASGFVDSQRCFVWRDQEFKTATISCGQQPEILLSN